MQSTLERSTTRLAALQRLRAIAEQRKIPVKSRLLLDQAIRHQERLVQVAKLRNL
jgi:hypothetical protein